jgi:hypothetical protein
MTVAEVLAVLERTTGYRPRRSGADWLTRCPAHADREPSLSVGEGADGRVLVHCFAECGVEAVLAACGLGASDLFSDNGRATDAGRRTAQPARDRAPAREPARLPGEPELEEWRAALLGSDPALSRLQALRGWTREAVERLELGLCDERVIIPIRDATGALVNVLRYAPNPQRRAGSKLLSQRGRPRELFPVPERVADGSGYLWLLEGEPDAVAAASLGLPAVAIPGVRGWRDAWAVRFRGRRVAVCFDSDRAGREAAQRIARAIAREATEVRLVDLDPTGEDGRDLTDWALPATTDELRAQARRLLEQTAEASPVVTPADAAGPPAEPADVVELAGVLERVERSLRRFVVLTDAQADALALWVAHTWAVDASDTTPYLSVTSAEKRSGKTRLLEVLGLLVRDPLPAANATPAALYRALAERPATLLLDEVDAIFGPKAREHEDLRALLNAGYRRGTPVLRCVGEGARMKVERFEVYGAKALAGIGGLPDTLADRALAIRLRRRTAVENVERLRVTRPPAELASIREALETWSQVDADEIAKVEPALPDELHDRAQDACEPLLAIADAAGNGWPQRAQRALVELWTGERDEPADSIGVLVLAACRAAFGTEETLSTETLRERLNADPEAAWHDWGGLTARRLATLLRPYGVRSRTVRVEGGATPKGYRRQSFEDAWSRYLPPSADANPPQAPQPLEQAENRDSESATTDASEGVVADGGRGANPHGQAVVADVADTSPIKRREA